MGNVYKDEKGHFTNKENEGGPCHHEGGREVENPNFNKEKYGQFFDENGQLIKGKEQEYFNAKNKNEPFDDDYEEEFNESLDGNKQDQYRYSDSEWLVDENGQEYKVDKNGKRTYKEQPVDKYNRMVDLEFNDDIEMPSDEEIMKQRYEEEKAKLDKEFPDRGDPELEAEIGRLIDNEMNNMVKNAKKNGQNAQQALDSVSYDLDIDPEDSRFNKLKEMVKKEYAEPDGAIPHKPVEMPKYRKEKNRIVIEEGPHKDESYDSEEDYYNSVRSEDDDLKDTLKKMTGKDFTDEMIEELRKALGK